MNRLLSILILTLSALLTACQSASNGLVGQSVWLGRASPYRIICGLVMRPIMRLAALPAQPMRPMFIWCIHRSRRRICPA